MLLEQPSQYLAPSKGCTDLVLFGLFLWQNPQLFLSYIQLMFLTCCLTESSAVFVIHSANVFNMLFPCI